MKGLTVAKWLGAVGGGAGAGAGGAYLYMKRKMRGESPINVLARSKKGRVLSSGSTSPLNTTKSIMKKYGLRVKKGQYYNSSGVLLGPAGELPHLYVKNGKLFNSLGVWIG